MKCAVGWLLKLRDLLKELKEKRRELQAVDGDSRMTEFKKAVKGKHLTCDDLTEAETDFEVLAETRFQGRFGYAKRTSEIKEK